MKDWKLANDNGVTRLWKKAILKTGEFEKSSTGEEFEIDLSFLEHLQTTFQKWTEAGHRVPIPVEHTTNPEKNRGFAKGLKIEGDTLYSFMEFPRDYDPSLMDVSIHVPVEERGFKRPLSHIALTSYPVIPGLGRFEAISASLNSAQGDKPVPFDFKKLGTTLKLSEELTEDNAESILLSELKELRKKNGELEEEKTSLETKLAASKTIDFSELQETAKKLPGAIAGVKKGRLAALKSLTLGDSPKINKFVMDKLESRYCSEEALTLSLADEDGKSEFDFLMSVLEHNEIPKVGETTGAQDDITLSDKNKATDTKNELAMAVESLQPPKD